MKTPDQTPAKVVRKLKTVRVLKVAEANPAVTVVGPEGLIPLVAALYAPLDANKEHFVALSLNTRNRVTGWHLVSTGSINTSIVHPRELFSAMLRLDAVSVVLVHNHPSNETSPSNDDLGLTRRLVAAGALLGIEVLDHLIIGPVPEVGLPEWLSFKLEGHL